MILFLKDEPAPLTMSSREIVELLEKRHDDVKRSVKRLAERGVFDVPPMAEDQIETGHGRKHTVQVYHLDERSSYIVVAQLPPEFTARLVDEWKALKE
ncbi:Rha family transcriptional regulator [Mameliella sediminis]|uniref:Rha family transcriptional regulator n=1 Tax=Mameliella sediminis TaxID=2836866 RepID=UPI001C4871F7|nr:Rha family transcriptional regulator [Mameliella sediminis]MBV7394107.1 Rha family transcriptional regulator [Mameliella sediminis]